MLGAATVLLGVLQEIRYGPTEAMRLVTMQSTGDFCVPLTMVTDSGSIWSCLQSNHLRMPTEKGTLYHLAYCLESLRNGLVSEWLWVDTRDMCIDGLTKGSLKRDALNSLMRGIWSLNHEVKMLKSPPKRSPASSDE